MAQKKKNQQKTYTVKKQTAKNKKQLAEERRIAEEKRQERRALWGQIIPYLLIVSAILIVIFFFTGRGEDPGKVSELIYKGITGFFSVSSIFLPFFLVFAAICEFLDKRDRIIGLRAISALVSSVLVGVLFELISPAEKISELFSRGTDLKGGGIFCGLIGQAFLFCFKSAASFVIVIAALILTIMLSCGITPKTVFLYVKCKIDEAKVRRAEEAQYYEEEEEYEEAPVAGRQLPLTPAPKIKKKPERRAKFDTDVPIDDDEDDEDDGMKETEEEKRARIEKERFDNAVALSLAEKSEEELQRENAVFENVKPEKLGSEDALAAEILDKLADSYGDGNGEMQVKREVVSEAEPKQVPIDIPKPEYKFPPIELLSEGSNPVKAQNVREELHENAAKLVNVLASFNVRTKIVGVSRGPTITRYELLPEPGTRVKSIANLVDDIALNLATSGVRIEAPIPGKAAVGIEVPNKTSETVYLRSLIADKGFVEHKSKISSALGKDVAGSAVLMDIQKMPHLLIAGATGMGKSVCINSLLVSLLYKATPDDVKLILIDPKKVEFSIYNGLPHLLVPVVSDPKKAAGSLTWAVNEMERRFGLIESVGVREIDGYNKITENDPDYEHLSRIVIVIDELADLMSTAPDDVETSIARLAAKARAAGMHLVIGTQRPSVDVITGVIKANIPSRIAFTVASQVDSRTIIDRSGAENLIGRGDMLYNPVGAAKPLRVQGAFVSDSEVDSVVSFIKANNCQGGADYSDEVMKEIEAQAALCGAKKGSGGGFSAGEGAGADSGDPLIDQALEVAFESGKISTSLLQRRLSVGYGRAAKIIDKMEEMGYVSAPEGQKPRQLLITKQEYMEKLVRKEDAE